MINEASWHKYARVEEFEDSVEPVMDVGCSRPAQWRVFFGSGRKKIMRIASVEFNEITSKNRRIFLGANGATAAATCEHE
jgi:hypothetical protein